MKFQGASSVARPGASVRMPIEGEVPSAKQNVEGFDFQSISSYFHNELGPYMELCAHIIVSGLVQGVGFRYFVSRQAARLGLTGYVANLLDGSVEIMANGERSLLEEFVGVVRVGPRAAHVRDLSVDWQPADHRCHSFEIR